MKWNWGTGIVVGMLCFMSFIMFMIVRMSTEKKFDHDLVTEDYYGKELHFQQEIEAEKNLKLFSGEIKTQRIPEGWEIVFPDGADNIKGEITFYRPSNKKLDFTIPLKIVDRKMIVPKENLVEGRWNIILEMKYKGKDVLYKQEILY
ncbi:FixH family protein [Zunongwangia sp.]|uniref:FixH family protein n=1 Tax=Zunongwangia sp. TaxID=1965325 RepID=UPI003AA8DA8F